MQEALLLNNTHSINFVTTEHLVFHKEQFLAKHTNGMMLSVYADDNKLLQQQTYFSIGGGFIITDEENIATDDVNTNLQLPYEFRSAKQLLHLCRVNQLTIAKLMLENEEVWRSKEQTKVAILNIAQVMQASIDRGCQQVGVLPGGLNVRRRASALFTKLTQGNVGKDNKNYMQWLNLFAIAVNEENAAGGRIVTAPINGAAGIIPAVLQYCKKFYPRSKWWRGRRFSVCRRGDWDPL